MPFIRTNARIVRTIPTAGFTGDPDWVGDFNAAGARAAGSNTFVPTRSGGVEIFWAFANNLGQAVAPDIFSRVDLEVIGLASDDPSSPGGNAIVSIGVIPNASASKTHKLTRSIEGPIVAVVRVGDLQGPVPVSAESIVVLARIG